MLAGVQYGIPVAQIYRAGNNPLLDRMIARFRGHGAELIPKGTVAAHRSIAALRRGMHLTLLADQKMNDGIPVPFFGRLAMTAPALAVLINRAIATAVQGFNARIFVWDRQHPLELLKEVPIREPAFPRRTIDLRPYLCGAASRPMTEVFPWAGHPTPEYARIETSFFS